MCTTTCVSLALRAARPGPGLVAQLQEVLGACDLFAHLAATLSFLPVACFFAGFFFGAAFEDALGRALLFGVARAGAFAFSALPSRYARENRAQLLRLHALMHVLVDHDRGRQAAGAEAAGHLQREQPVRGRPAHVDAQLLPAGSPGPACRRARSRRCPGRRGPGACPGGRWRRRSRIPPRPPPRCRTCPARSAIALQHVSPAGSRRCPGRSAARE